METTINKLLGLKAGQGIDKAKVVLVKGSPAKLEEQLGVNVYFDQSGQITKQLGIKQVPATVAQEGKILKIMEVKV